MPSDVPLYSDEAPPISTVAVPGPVPFPTLYSGQDCGRPRGAIEMLLYNIASMLASFGAGYDVRLSNVQPVHPSLLPESRAEEEDRRLWYDPGPGSRQIHNTYHGHTPHHRTPLNLGRRRSPPSADPPSDLSLQPPPPVATGPGLDRPLNLPAPEYSGQDGPSSGSGSGSYMMNRTAKFYHDQLEGQREPLFVYPERHNYKDSPRRVSDSQQSGYSNPVYETQPASRPPGRVTFGHRRTPSGSSSYQLDQDRSGPSSSEYSERPPPLVPRRLSRGNGSEVERPQTLELSSSSRTPLRSSLKKYNYGGVRPDTSGWAGWGSGGGTPTNDNSSTEDVPICYPLTSLSKNDSGFVSTGRLNNQRFSPRKGDVYTDWSPTGGDQQEFGGSSREIREDRERERRSRGGGGGSYSADSPSRRIHHPYADFITENDLKKGFDYFSKH